MKIKVNPNRMEVLRLRKRLALASRGHALLKNKQDELMKRFNEAVSGWRKRRREAESALSLTYQKFLLASGLSGSEVVKEAAQFTDWRLSVGVKEKRILGLKVPEFTLEETGSPYSYGLLNTSAELDEAYGGLTSLFPLLIKLTETEKTIEILAGELEKTRRRVNVLEYVLIPSLKETIGYIMMRLSEMERARISRLMKFKNL